MGEQFGCVWPSKSPTKKSYRQRKEGRCVCVRMSLFVVKCGIDLLWHPVVHHSLLLLRALKQRHTLMLEPSSVVGTCSEDFWHLSHSGGLVLITTKASSGSDHCNTSFLTKGEKTVEHGQLVGTIKEGLQCVRDPQHIFYFFSAYSSLLQEQQGKKLQAYLDAVFVAGQVLRAVDDVLVALRTEEMEVIRQTNANLMDLVARLDSCLQTDDEIDDWGTWPLFSTLQFLVEEGGLLLGPFPRLTKAYSYLKNLNSVVAHTRLVKRTVDLALNEQGSSAELPAWPHRGFLCKLQHKLAEYTADPVERMTEGVSGGRAPLKTRVSGARFGLQRLSTRLPWTMQRG